MADGGTSGGADQAVTSLQQIVVYLGKIAGYLAQLPGIAVPLSGASGGTGVANTGKTITIGGNLTTTPANAVTFTTTGATNVTLPTAGTLAVLGANTFTALQTMQAGVRTTPVAVAGLTAAATAGAGARWFVTDSTATLAAGLGNIVAGGGANNVPVYSDGTDWRIG